MKVASLGLVALAVFWCPSVSARSTDTALAVSSPVEGSASAPLDQKQLPPKAAPNENPSRGDQKKNLVRGREHEKAAKAAFDLGVKFGRAGRLKEAVEAFREAVLYNPSHADAYFSLGHALYDLGQWAAAVEALNHATTLNPKDAEAFNYLGAAYFRQGLYDKAIEAYKGAILLKPNLTDVRYNIANAFYKLGRYEPALLYYTEVSHLKPKSAELLNDMGVAYAEWGRHGEAAEAFKRAVGHDSDDAYAYNNLALSYYLQGQAEEAVKAFARATRLAPDNEAISRNASLASSSLGLGSAAVGNRVSLVIKAGVGDDRRNIRWLGRSDVIRGVEGSGSPAPAVNAPPAAAARPAQPVQSNSTPPIKKDSAPLPPEVAMKTAAAPYPSPTPSSVETDTQEAEIADSGIPDEGNGAASEEGDGAAPATSEPPAAPAPTSIYRVGVGDVLDIRLLDDKTTDSTLYTVLAGGLVEYAPLGEPFAAAGMTTDEIEAHIKSKLRRDGVRGDPQVVVSVREYASHTVIVSGLVAEPGVKVLRREAVPLYVIIADAKPLPEAGQVLVTSGADGQRTEAALDDHAAMSALVRPSDVINVLGKQKQFYYIGGKVEAPGQKEFHTGITLTQAILAAGGALQASKTALVTRQSADGLLSASRYNLKEIMSGREPDPPLRPGDRIEVLR